MKKYIIGGSVVVALLLVRMIWFFVDKDELPVVDKEEIQEVEKQIVKPTVSLIGCVKEPITIEFTEGDKLIDVLDRNVLKDSYSAIELDTLLYKPLKDKTVLEVKCKASVYFTGCVVEEKLVYFESGDAVGDVINQVTLKDYYSVIKYDTIKYDLLKTGKNINIECKKSATVSGAVIESKTIYFEDNQKLVDVLDQFELDMEELDTVLYNGMKNTVLTQGKNIVIPAKRTFYVIGLEPNKMAFRYTEGDTIDMYLEKVKELATCQYVDDATYMNNTLKIYENQEVVSRCLQYVTFTGEIKIQNFQSGIVKGEKLSSIKIAVEFMLKTTKSDFSQIDWDQEINEDLVINIPAKA